MRLLILLEIGLVGLEKAKIWRKNSKESFEGISPFHRTQITINRYIAMINEKIDKISDFSLIDV